MSDERTRDLAGQQRRDSRADRELRHGDLIGPWQIQGALGGGGFGAVYEVANAGTGARAALKLLHAHFVASPEMLARFEREVDVLRRLSHPNIIQLVDAGFSADDRPYFCMELLVGVDLRQLIDQRGRLAPAEVIEILEQLSEALSVAHELNVIHRDIKAANVFVCPAAGSSIGRVVLLDFGIAKLCDALAPELTASRQSLGTPSCMAPEQIHGLRVDARTDVYALGGLVFHMLTGRLPFQDASATMTQYLHLHARRPRISSIVGGSSHLDDVIMRAMAIDPAERFSDPRSLFAAAHAALRESRMIGVPARAVPSVALLVIVGDRTGGASLDVALLDDLEGVLPAAERWLVPRGFRLVVDFGASVLFVATADELPDPGTVAAALAAALVAHLDARAGRDPRVRVGVGVRSDHAMVIGEEIQPCALIQPATWELPEVVEGLWVSRSGR